MDCCIPVFFFQAEDGIRDGHVTGVQTCALPISPPEFIDDRDSVAVVVEGEDRQGPLKIGRASCRERVERSVAGGPLKKKTGGKQTRPSSAEDGDADAGLAGAVHTTGAHATIPGS